MSSSTKHLQIITRHRHNWRCRFHHIPETLTCWYTQTKCHYCLVFVKILPEQEICHYMHRLPTRGCWPLLAIVSTSVRHRGMAHWDGTQVWHLTHVLLTSGHWWVFGVTFKFLGKGQEPRLGADELNVRHVEDLSLEVACKVCFARRPAALHQLFLARMNWMSDMQSIYYKHMKYNAIWWNVVHKNNNIHNSQGD